MVTAYRLARREIDTTCDKPETEPRTRRERDATHRSPHRRPHDARRAVRQWAPPATTTTKNTGTGLVTVSQSCFHREPVPSDRVLGGSNDNVHNVGSSLFTSRRAVFFCPRAAHAGLSPPCPRAPQGSDGFEAAKTPFSHRFHTVFIPFFFAPKILKNLDPWPFESWTSVGV